MKISRFAIMIFASMHLFWNPGEVSNTLKDTNPMISPMYKYIADSRCTLRISSGRAYITASARGQAGQTTSLRASIYLQRWDGATWVTVFSDSTTGTTRLTYSSSTTASQSGKYRLRVVFTANNKETVTNYDYATR